jgi:2-keto-4-pentenoate hydratase/2-oxohepta-3-ene-1,7-dioic acid hydratase in catechol pathway
MKWATYRSNEPGDLSDRVGLVVDEQIFGLDPGVRLVDLLGDLPTAAEKAKRAPAEVRALSQARLRPPIPQPPTIRDFSSFQEHHQAGIQAIGQKWDDAWFEVPFFYFSNPSTMLGDGDVFAKPPNSNAMDYELEMCAIIGKEGIDIDPAEADSYIAGYTIFNDWSARDLQRDEMARAPVGPAKGKDTANSMGPYLVTPDEIEDRRKGNGYDLAMKSYVNGKLYTEGTWGTIYWSMAEHIAYASRNTRLLPGDVLCTGTCGTGCVLELSLRPGGKEAYPWLKEGDELVLEVEGIGRLRNRIGSGQPPHPIRGRINGSRV